MLLRLAILLHCLAIVLLLRLAPLRYGRLPWILLTLALVLSIGRLLFSYRLHGGGQHPIPELLIIISLSMATALLMVVGMYLAATVTQRLQQAKDALHASAEKYGRIVEHSVDGITLVDEQGVLIEWNDGEEQITGIPRSEALGQFLWDIQFRVWQPADQTPSRYQLLRLLILDALRTGNLPYTLRPTQWTIQHTDGTTRIIQVMTYTIQTESGFMLGGITRDVTARKQFEDALERERTLRAAIIDFLPFPVAVLAPSGCLEHANSAAYHFFGITEFTGDLPATFLYPDTRTPIPLEYISGALALRGETQDPSEALIVFPDGREVPVLLQAAPVLVKDEIAAAVLTLQDISKLKAADRAKDDFLALVSHELLTPLTAILGWAREAILDAEISPEALVIIENNARRQQRLIADLLDLSRIAHQKISLAPERLNLWQLAEDCVEEQCLVAQQRHIRLLLDAPAVPLPILADPLRIRQVITNLLTNALKFTGPGDVITVSGRWHGMMAELSVQDTGCGIAPEQLPRIFKPFYQVDSTYMNSGLGLGLALVRGLVELHGGEVSVDSPGAGQGSCFTIKLPLLESNELLHA